LDTVIVNANVLTMDPTRPAATGFAIDGKRIAAIGAGPELGPAANVVDLGGRTVVPGFIDAHTHFGPLVLSATEVNLQDPPMPNIPAIQERIATAVAKARPGDWVRAFGYGDEQLAERRHPTRWELDEVAPDNPVIVIHWGYHRLVANSAALALAGVDRNHPEIAGGVLHRDADGELNGLLTEAGTNGVLQTAIDAVMAANAGELNAWVEAECRHHLEQGITAVHDAWVSPKFEILFRAAAEAGSLPLYYTPLRGHYEGLFGSPAPWLEPGAIDQHNMPDHFRTGGIKLFASGVWESVIYYSQDELNSLMARAHTMDLAVAVHVSSDAGTEMAIRAAEHTHSVSPSGSAPIRLEHFFWSTDAGIARLKRSGAGVVTQPGSMWRFGSRTSRPMAEGVKRIPIASLAEAGVPVAFSSDAPCFPVSPLIGVCAAVTRQNRAGESIAPAEAITPYEALRMYTLGAAWANATDNVEGSISPGKLANFAVLSADPTAVDPHAIRDIKVEETWVDGVRVIGNK
jgi:predicted amidohydrolase YtcJ